MQQMQFTVIRGDAALPEQEVAPAKHKLKLVPQLATGQLEASYGGYQALDASGRIVQQVALAETHGKVLNIKPGWDLFRPLESIRHFLANRAQEHFFRDLASEVPRQAGECQLVGISRGSSVALIRDSQAGFEYELALDTLRRYWNESGIDGIRNGLPFLLPKAKGIAEKKAQDIFLTSPLAALLPRVGVLETPHVFCPVASSEFSLSRGASLGEGLTVELVLLAADQLLVLDEAACCRLGPRSKNLGVHAAVNAKGWNRYLPSKMPTPEDPVWTYEGCRGLASVLFINMMFDRRVLGDSNIAFALPARDQLVVAHVKSPNFDLVRTKVAQIHATAVRPVSPHFYIMDGGELQTVD
jgi:hypothetical protein